MAEEIKPVELEDKITLGDGKTEIEIKPAELTDDMLGNVPGGSEQYTRTKVKYRMIVFSCPKPDCNRMYAWTDAYEPDFLDEPRCDWCGARMFVTAKQR